MDDLGQYWKSSLFFSKIKNDIISNNFLVIVHVLQMSSYI